MLELALTVLLGAFLVALLIITAKFIALQRQVQVRALELFERWKETALEREASGRAELLHREWVISQEARVRRDAIEKSEAVVRGKVTEHLLPFFPDFPYNPRDARFLGSPVDFIVFSGMSSGDLHEIVFIEVKSGRNASLSSRERMVRDCVDAGRVRYTVYRTGEL
ncbi:MAG: Holliday junction resolvase [Methanolinea sp.]|nr:Holliday junction resolvase [Methanolinea sp.]